MKTLILPGFSIYNKQWAEQVKKNLDTNNINSEIITWDHWTTGNDIDFNVNNEIKKVLKATDNEQFNIIAKSIGTYITAKLVRDKQLYANKVVLCGIPINGISDDMARSYRSLINLPPENILIVQNNRDPHGGIGIINDLIQRINPNVKVTEKIADNHDYPYYNDILNFLSKN